MADDFSEVAKFERDINEKRAAMPDPTPEQIENAKAAGWDVGEPGDPDYPKAPPEGWDAHGADPGPVEVLEGPGEAE